MAQPNQSSSTALSIITAKLAGRFGTSGEELLDALRQTAFRQRPDAPPVTDAQMLALILVADQYGLNPWTREIYAFPDKANGIVPVVGVDGWTRIINSHPQFDGLAFQASENIVTPPGGKPCPEWIECTIYRKDRSRALTIREYLDEVYREPFGTKYGVQKGPWQSHTKRFLRHKALIQAARVAFGFVGIYDQDEAERIIEGTASQINDAEYKADSFRRLTKDAEAPELPAATLEEFRAMLERASDKASMREATTYALRLPGQDRPEASRLYQLRVDELRAKTRAAEDAAGVLPPHTHTDEAHDAPQEEPDERPDPIPAPGMGEDPHG